MCVLDFKSLLRKFMYVVSKRACANHDLVLCRGFIHRNQEQGTWTRGTIVGVNSYDLSRFGSSATGTLRWDFVFCFESLSYFALHPFA